MPGSLESTTKIYNVLFVDDRRDILNTLELMGLEHYEFHYAPSGRIALNMLEEQYIDLCIVDYKMPGMDGLTLIKAIKKEYSHMPIILLTAYPSNELYKKVTTRDCMTDYVMEKSEDVFSQLLKNMDDCLRHGGIHKHYNGINHYQKYKRMHGIEPDTSKHEEREKRLLNILEDIRIRPHFWTSAGLSKKYGKCRQRIIQDIEVLRKRGHDIQSNGKKGGFWLLG